MDLLARAMATLSTAPFNGIMTAHQPMTLGTLASVPAPVDRPTGTGTAVVLILAMVATGEYSSVEEACRAIVRERDVVEPRAEEAKIYSAGRAVYRLLYPALKPLFPRMV